MDEQATFEPQAVLGRRRAGWNRLLLLVPAVALALTAWAGLSGPRSPYGLDNKPVDNAMAEVSTAPVVVAAPSRAPSGPGYPPTVIGLDVQAVDDLERYPPRDDLAVAIAGWYVAGATRSCPLPTVGSPPAFVAELGVDANGRTFCARSGLLFFASPGADADTVAPLSVALTPGVVVPAVVNETARTPSAVVLVGRMAAADAAAGRAVSPFKLLVDRVVWAVGLGQAQTTSILPALLDTGPMLSWRPRDRLAEATIGPTGAILMETLVDQPTLARVDPAAAALVGDTSPQASRIWYRRALGSDPARIAPSWVAIDDTTGAVIGSGIVE